MDKKFMAMVAVMLAVCLFIISGGGTASKTGEALSTTSGSSDAAYVSRFFDKNKVIEIYVTLSESDFADMLQNPTKEEYKQASVVVNGEKTENVGFRVKGNSSLSSVARSKSNRYSFKLDMDHYIDGQNLAGLTKLNLNNSFSDSSYMREYLSYSLLEETGIPTPAYSYANVYVNGELLGLYLAVEGLEEPFLERYYGSNYGNLYKPEGQGSDLVYVDDNMQSYSGIAPVFAAKNGADKALLAMLKALNQGKDLEKYLNIEEILRYFAVNTVLVNMDSYLSNMKHNYYLYEKNGVFSILPWDYNMSFGGFAMGGGGNSSTSLAIDQPVSGTSLAERPLLGKLLEIQEYKDLYHQYIEEFVQGPFNADKMQAEIERVAEMIRPHLEKDPTKFYTMEQFEQAISAGAQTQNASVQAQGNSESPRPAVQDTGELPPADFQPSGVPFPAPEEGAQRALPEGEGQIQPGRDGAAMRGQQQGGGMMQGGANLGLIKFIRDRIENVTKQLNGESPTTGNTTEQSNGNMMRGRQPGNRQNGQMPPGGMPRPEGVREPMQNMRGPVPGGADGGPGNMAGGGIGKMSVQQMYLIGGSILLLLAAILMVFKRKTKYSM